MASNPLGPIRVVLTGISCRDPALDFGGCECDAERHDAKAACPKWRDGTDVVKYGETQDEALLRFREGASPTWCYLVPLKQSMMAGEIDTLAHMSMRWSMAFRAACHRIELPGGEVLAVADDEWISKRQPKVASNEWMDRVGDVIGTTGIYELGQIALGRARLPAAAHRPLD